jgi:hypothetical protein
MVDVVANKVIPHKDSLLRVSIFGAIEELADLGIKMC